MAWTAEQKAAIVAESQAADVSVSEVARRHGVDPKQLFKWRSLRRVTVNTPGFEQPKLDHAPARPDPVARTQPNPRLAEPPPAGQYALRPVADFALDVARAANGPWAVTEADLPDLFEWGVPLYQERFPGATVESMVPLVRRAIQGYPYRALHTPDAFGIFMADQKPWMPRPVVFDLFVAWQGEHVHQAVQICRNAREWARSIGAAEFQIIECEGSLMPLAERLGLKDITHTYSVKL